VYIQNWGNQFVSGTDAIITGTYSDSLIPTVTETETVEEECPLIALSKYWPENPEKKEREIQNSS